MDRTAHRDRRERARRPPVGDHHLGAGEWRRHRPHQSDGRPRRRRSRAHPGSVLRRIGRQALRQRLGHRRPHDHHRAPRGRGRAGDLRPRHPGPRLGRVERTHAAGALGRHRHGRDPEPRDAPRALPRDADGVGRSDHRHHAGRGTTRGQPVHGRRPGCARRGRGDRAVPARAEGVHAARLRAGGVVSGRDGPLARRPGVRGCAPDGGRGRASARGARDAARRSSPSRSWPRRRWPAWPGSSVVARSRVGRRSARGSRTCAALGFLRPPWGLAYDGLYATSFG